MVGCMVIFILFVSYKILEPDIKGKVTQVEADSKGLPVAREDNSDAEEVETPRDPEEIVKELRQKYWLDFSFPLKDSPWRLAERMVNDRKVHPEYVPELGMIMYDFSHYILQDKTCIYLYCIPGNFIPTPFLALLHLEVILILSCFKFAQTQDIIRIKDQRF